MGKYGLGAGIIRDTLQKSTGMLLAILVNGQRETPVMIKIMEAQLENNLTLKDLKKVGINVGVRKNKGTKPG